MDKEQAYARATALCSKQEKCVSDMRKKLYDWQVSLNNHDEIIDQLIAHKYIDEVRFATYFVRDKYRFNQWGRIKIRYHLQQKQLPSHLIDKALEEIDDDEYSENLKHALQVKNRSIKADNEYERRNKLMRFAAGRGFTPEEISRALSDVFDQ